MSRAEFSVRVRKQAWDRANGVCECGCDQPFTKDPKDRPNYDHELPDFLGGTNDLENCKVIRFCCHHTKTKDVDTPRIVKARTADKKRKGLEPRKAKIPGSKGTGLRKKLDGTVLRISE